MDDCSKDDPPQIAQKLAAQDARVKFVRQQKNGGKTEALKTGFALTKGEIVIVQDADLEYDPGEISDVISPILEGRADVAIRDGRIAAIGNDLGDAKRVIDATGKYVLPGGIEAHCHIEQDNGIEQNSHSSSPRYFLRR